MNDSARAARDDELLAQLDETTARLLFPDRFPEALRVSLEFPALRDALSARATDLLAVAEVESTAERQQASFTLAHVAELQELFALVDTEYGSAAVDVRINGKRLPMTRELWLPLFWSLRS